MKKAYVFSFLSLSFFSQGAYAQCINAAYTTKDNKEHTIIYKSDNAITKEQIAQAIATQSEQENKNHNFLTKDQIVNIIAPEIIKHDIIDINKAHKEICPKNFTTL